MASKQIFCSEFLRPGSQRQTRASSSLNRKKVELCLLDGFTLGLLDQLLSLFSGLEWDINPEPQNCKAEVREETQLEAFERGSRDQS